MTMGAMVAISQLTCMTRRYEITLRQFLINEGPDPALSPVVKVCPFRLQAHMSLGHHYQHERRLFCGCHGFLLRWAAGLVSVRPGSALPSHARGAYRAWPPRSLADS